MDDMILVHRNKSYLQYSLSKIKEKCEYELKLSLNQKTQIGIVKNGIDFLGYRHILIVDDEYFYIRKNAFYNHIKDTKESQKF